MERISLNRNWQFKYAAGVQGVQESKVWTSVDLPHDAGISMPRFAEAVGGASNAFYPGCNCIYEKEVDMPAEWLGRSILLELEGAYMNAVVFVNRQLAGRHPYGYTSFHCDLSSLLKEGKNTLRIEVNNGGLANTRWYSGSGLYRPVSLLIGAPVHVGPWDVAVTTPEALSDSSSAQAVTTVRNAGAEPVSLVLRTGVWSEASLLGQAEERVEIPAAGSVNVMQIIPVSPVHLWTPDDPFLYELKTELVVAGECMDGLMTRFGFRTVSVDAVNGFSLNGRTLKMKGGCVHHDCGLLGAAAYPRAEERKVELLKASGFNAVRCAHNPPSVAFLNACDRLGMLVIDESFDCFRHGKNPGDYSLVFEDWWERDLTAMVLRDRNHPSIVMWSTGNEIIERNGWSDGAVWSRKLADCVRALDPNRPVTNALCDLWEEVKPGETPESVMTRFDLATTAFAEPLDVVGYNYLLHRYEHDATRYPGRVICGTETFPKDAFDYWEATERLPHVIGDFVWTSLDYLGEAGLGHEVPGDKASGLKPYPWHHANCGDLDICGQKRPQSHYRDCVWGIAKKPYIAVHDPALHGTQLALSPWGWPDVVSSWNWPGQEGNPCTIDVYSMDEEVLLLLDGQEIGRQPAGKANRYLASFETVYVPGKLEAVGLTCGGECTRTVLLTSGNAHAILLSADRNDVSGENGELVYVTVEVTDENGDRVPVSDNSLHFTVCGAGSLLAVGNGDPVSTEPFTGNVRKVWRGLAMAVIRTSGEKGDLLLTVSAEGLTPASLYLPVR